MRTPTTPPIGWRMVQEGETVPDNTPFLVWEFGDGPWRPRTRLSKHPLVGKLFHPMNGRWSPLAVPHDCPVDFSQYDEGGIV